MFQAIHDGMDCKQYQQSMLVDSQDENSKKTKEWMDVSLDLLIQKFRYWQHNTKKDASKPMKPASKNMFS